MERVIVRPDGLDLDSHGRRDYWVALEHDSIWGDHLMPLTVYVGPEAKDGPMEIRVARLSSSSGALRSIAAPSS